MPSPSPSPRHSRPLRHSRAGGNLPSLTASQIRQQFIDFFVQKHAHTFVPSSPVVPHDDPTLLFTNAGMNQFKPIFLGQANPNSELAKLTRAANSQKCIRAGGKHNDLDDVGKDLYHHTFFEMLGNWSFGDYFKSETIAWAWELLTEVWQLDPERLYATYFQGNADQQLEPDTEARDLWLQYLPQDRVLPGDMKDNFWEMGDTGPCGPCSEIHYDGRSDDQRATTPGHDLVNKEHADVIELWNLVFIQFNTEYTVKGLEYLKQAKTMTDIAHRKKLYSDALTLRERQLLPDKHVDTGLGLERIARILQGVNSNYDTDLFTPLFDAIQKITGAAPYKGELDSLPDTAYRVIADHIRTLTFAIADGGVPSNEKRGYVLRSILRRAVFYGRFHLNASDGFLHKLVPTVVETMGDFFPEISKQQKHVAEIIADEEAAFGKTIEQGLHQFQLAITLEEGTRSFHFAAIRAKRQRQADAGPIKIVGLVGKNAPAEELTAEDIESHSKQKEIMASPAMISAVDAFKLHDTYGFPIGLTKLMAEERGLTVDEAGFERLMEEAREKSRSGGKDGADDPVRTLPVDVVADLQNRDLPATQNRPVFEQNNVQTIVIAVWDGARIHDSAPVGARVAVICKETNFYAQMGGQVADIGTIASDSATIDIQDTRLCAGYVLHIGAVKDNPIAIGDSVELRRNAPRRQAIARNHTATHLLNLALRDILGANVEQKGSLVAPDRLRFDFSHNTPITHDEIARIEAYIKTRADKDLSVYAQEVPLSIAKGIAGLRAVFGETYPDPVRIISVGIPIEKLLSDPKNKDFEHFSIEFCGGTHLANTEQIQHIALTQEEAVAKGIRRIVMLTGQAALDANELGAQLLARAHEASALEGSALADEVHAILSELENRTVGLVCAHEVRQSIEKLREKMKATQKESAKSGREEAVSAARALAESASGDVIVGEIPAGGDRQALLAAMDCVRAIHKDAAILLASIDSELEKVAIVASCSKGVIAQGLKAGDWVREVSGVLGGKGGGRPDSAQGGGTDIAKVSEAIARAESLAREQLG